MIKQYKKRPVVINAAGPLTPQNQNMIAEWCGGEVDNGVRITTLEGVMQADYDDYVIRGVQGEFYPCKPDIFRETYEEVSGFLED